MTDTLQTSTPGLPDVVALAEALIACPSVTPAAGMVFDCLEQALRPLGFDVQRFITGEAPDGPVENLFAIRKGPEGSRHFSYAGHVDVVPPGEGWTSGPSRPSAGASCSMGAARWT
jgi:succinyl-diaminopimelate desuccinylase